MASVVAWVTFNMLLEDAYTQLTIQSLRTNTAIRDGLKDGYYKEVIMVTEKLIKYDLESLNENSDLLFFPGTQNELNKWLIKKPVLLEEMSGLSVDK